MIISLVIAYYAAPTDGKGHTAEDYAIEIKPLTVPLEPRKMPGEWFEYSPIVTVLISVI